MPKTVSFGVLVLDGRGALLLAHATGQRQWDIPKGGAEPGESPREAAARELREETGLSIAPGALHELGRFAYMPAKDLHLFSARLDAGDLDLAHCRCSSVFLDRFGRQRPEVDAFRWATPQELPGLCTARMAAALAQALPLAQQAGG